MKDDHSRQNPHNITNLRSETDVIQSSRKLIEECTQTTFYVDDFLREEIFIEHARKMAELFESKRMSQSSFRSLFNMLNQVDRDLAANSNYSFGAAQEQLFRFVRLCEYQTKRGVIQSEFLDFVNAHYDLAKSNKKEFHGFVEYLKSIMARLKTKP